MSQAQDREEAGPGAQFLGDGIPSTFGLVDSYGRFARKLRISVTDRCNFSCDFCMPANPIWMDQAEVLTFDEITRLTKIMVGMGVNKIRLSGGEPLVRRDIEQLVGRVAAIEGVKSVGMTTNGALLKEKAAALKAQGLDGITVSLHSLKPERYNEITGTKDMFQRVQEGIAAAKSVGIPIKVNCVVTKGCNEEEIPDFARLAHDSGITVRFIEYMPFDGTKLWNTNIVVSGKQIIEAVERSYELVPLDRENGSTAQTYRFADGSRGEIGTITSMTEPFCGDCDRIRLKADGKIVPCLFSTKEYDVKSLLRGEASDKQIAEFVRRSFWKKFEGIESLIKKDMTPTFIRPMHTIGG